MDTKLEEQHSWIKLQFLLTKVEEQLRIIFKKRWKSINGDDWTEKSQSQTSILISILGRSTFKTFGKIQKETLKSGETTQWDLSTISKILQNLKSPSPIQSVADQENNENQNMQSAIEVRNVLAHHPDKIIKNEEFKKLWSKLQPISLALGVPQCDISEIEFKFLNDSSSVLEEYLRLKGEANDLFKVSDFDGAIKLYSKALVLPNLSNDHMGILYSNRCASYLKLNTEEMSNMALSDAQNCEKYRPNWFKSHWRVAEAQMSLKNLSAALNSYNKALGLEPSCLEILEARDYCKMELIDESIQVDLDPYSNPDTKLFNKRLKENSDLDENILEQTRQIIEKIQIKEGDAYSNVLLGHRYRDGIKVEQNYETAVNFYTKASLEGQPEGLYNLALLKMYGKGCQKNMTEAINMLERAANDKKSPKMSNGAVAVGIAEAQFALGRAYQYGTGVPKSAQTAVDWYKKSSANGCGPAANNLGVMYNSGYEIPIDETLAVQYWEIATSCSLPVPRAMENLADYYLDKGNSKKAEMYWEMTKEHGNVFTQMSDDEFQKRLELIKMFEENNSSRNKSPQNFDKSDDISNNLTTTEIFEQFDKLKRMRNPQGPYSDVNLKDLNMEEISKASNNGSKYASQLLETMGHNVRFLRIVENKDLNEITKSEWKTIIIELGQAVSGHEYIVIKPSNNQFKAFFLQILKKILLKNETISSELDKWARFCYVNMNQTSYVEMVSFLTQAIRKYPQIARFCHIKVCMYGFMQDFGTGLVECEKYLTIFPNNTDLLYVRAVSLKNLVKVGDISTFKRAISAYEEYLKFCVKDHRKVPMAYYNIGILYMTGETKSKEDNLLKAKEFYKKGLEAEKLQFSIFLPYDSNEKELLSMIFKLKPNLPLEKMNDIKMAEISKIQPKNDPNKYLMNPKRIMIIKRHREGMADTKLNHFNTSARPLKSQQAPKTLVGLAEIFLVDMDPTKDKTYNGKLINLTVIDDPNPYAPSIHLVVQDDLFDVQKLCVYNFNRKKEVEKIFGFGTKFTLLNPYMRMADDSRPMLRVDDPNSIIFNPGNEDILSKKLCFYCCRENSEHLCSKCKRNFCSRGCQMKDWKILKHKLICWE